MLFEVILYFYLWYFINSWNQISVCDSDVHGSFIGPI